MLDGAVACVSWWDQCVAHFNNIPNWSYRWHGVVLRWRMMWHSPDRMWGSLRAVVGHAHATHSSHGLAVPVPMPMRAHPASRLRWPQRHPSPPKNTYISIDPDACNSIQMNQRYIKSAGRCPDDDGGSLILAINTAAVPLDLNTWHSSKTIDTLRETNSTVNVKLRSAICHSNPEPKFSFNHMWEISTLSTFRGTLSCAWRYCYSNCPLLWKLWYISQ